MLCQRIIGDGYKATVDIVNEIALNAVFGAWGLYLKSHHTTEVHIYGVHHIHYPIPMVSRRMCGCYMKVIHKVNSHPTGIQQMVNPQIIIFTIKGIICLQNESQTHHGAETMVPGRNGVSGVVPISSGSDNYQYCRFNALPIKDCPLRCK